MPKERKEIVPAAGQMAVLHALLCELEENADRLNFPLVCLIYTVGNVIQASFLEKVVSFVMPSLSRLSEEYPSIVTPMTVAAMFFLIYIYNKEYQYDVNLAAKIFPNGLRYDRKKHAAYALQKQLLTAEKAAQTTQQLRQLVAKQNKDNTALSIIFMMIAFKPFLSSITVSSTPDSFNMELNSFVIGLSFNAIGPAINFSNTVQQGIPYFLDQLSRISQSLSFYRYIYKKWTNYRKDADTRNFLNQLKTLTSLAENQREWQVVSLERSSKKASLFLLRLDGLHELRFTDSLSQLHEIDKQSYFIELHRLLLTHSIPTYVSLNGEVYVGYSKTIEKKADTLSKILQERLTVLEKFESASKETLTALRSLDEAVYLKSGWSSYTYFDGDQRKVSFYRDISNVPMSDQDKYIQVLKTTGECSREGNIIHVDHFITKDKWVDFKKQMRDAREEKDNSTKQVTVKGDKPKPVKSQRIEHKEAKMTAVASYKLTPEVVFKSGYRFSKELSEQKKPPSNYAYPLHVPYIPSGHAFGVVHPKALDAVQDVMSTDRIFAQLKNASVHGYREGGDGIQIVGSNSDNPESYETVEGEIQTSRLKMKFVSDNIRIFGHKKEVLKTEESEVYTLYQFDGPGWGH